MCGIVGYIGPRDATPIILNGLKRLEYRGYNSAGLAVVNGDQLEVRKDAGKLSQLIDLVNKSPINGAPGIGHTRWATHGAPNARNAHPHLGQTKRVVVVQNGIVENFLELKDELTAEGVEFQSETDTETIVHLVEHYLATGVGLVEAARKTFKQIQGANVVVLMSADEPDKIVTARIGNAGGVVLGLGEGENFIASDTPAILEHTRNVIFLESRQMAVVTRDTVTIETLDGAKVKPQVHRVSWDPVAAEKGAVPPLYAEGDPRAGARPDRYARRTRGFRQGENPPARSELDRGTGQEDRQDLHHSLWHRGLRRHGGKISDREDRPHPGGSGHRLRVPLQRPDPERPDGCAGDLTIRRDSRHAGSHGGGRAGRARIVWSIVNAIGSQAMRVSDGFISMQTGPEIGVASTKAFTAPLVDQYMLAILLADLRGVDRRQRPAARSSRT